MVRVMRLQTPAELNAYHRHFYRKQRRRIMYLLDRIYIQRFIEQKLLAASAVEQPFQAQRSFKSQLINYAENPDVGGDLARKICYARQPRRKAAGSGLSRLQIIMRFAANSPNRARRTKALWAPFFDELVRLGVNPSRSTDGSLYEYAGKRGRLTISYRQFEKLVSELAPRRPSRSRSPAT